MREILFRGKRVDNGEWVFGYYIKGYRHCTSPFAPIDYEVHYITYYEKEKKCFVDIEVVPETVGQYTGLTDKNGKKIFEGDIVNLHYFYTAYDSSTLGAYEAEDTFVAIIRIWDMGVGFDRADGKDYGYLHDWLESPQDELEVIGNVFDYKLEDFR